MRINNSVPRSATSPVYMGTAEWLFGFVRNFNLLGIAWFNRFSIVNYVINTSLFIPLQTKDS